jgi:hypothetical protein
MIRRVAAIVAFGALATRAAEAAPPVRSFAEALHVEPNACFDAASLAPEIARWRGRDVLDRRVEVEIAGQLTDAAGLLLRVWRDGRIVGERRFPGLAGPCPEVREAVGLATALAVDAILIEAEGATQEASTRGPAAPPQGAPASPPAWRPRFFTEIDGIALVRVLPSPAGALAPGFGVGLAPAFDLRVSGLLTGAGWVGLRGGSVGATLLAGRADACGALALGVLRARACLGLSAGRIQVTTTGLSPSLAPSAPWAAGDGRVDLRAALAPWIGLVLGGDLVVPMTRPTFEVITPAGAAVATVGLPVLGGAVSLGPEITFR